MDPSVSLFHNHDSYLSCPSMERIYPLSSHLLNERTSPSVSFCEMWIHHCLMLMMEKMMKKNMNACYDDDDVGCCDDVFGLDVLVLRVVKRLLNEENIVVMELDLGSHLLVYQSLVQIVLEYVCF